MHLIVTTFYVSLALVANAVTIYVSEQGNDFNNNECTEHNPCGTLYWSTFIRHNNTNYNALNDIEIYIEGINYNEVRIWSINHSICSCYSSFITLPTTISFHPNTSKTANDWFDPDLCFICSSNTTNTIRSIFHGNIQSNDGNDNNLIINNLNINHQSIAYLENSGTIILNNSSLQNITLNTDIPSISAPNIAIYNTTFSDIISENPQLMGFIHVYAEHDDNDKSMIIEHSIIKNLNLFDSHFIFAHSVEYLYINDCIFNNTYLQNNYALIYLQYGDTNAYIHINHTLFYHINYGGIAYLGKGCDSTLKMNNIDITTTHSNSVDLSNNDVALIMVTSTAKLEISNVNLTYLWIEYLDDYCHYDIDDVFYIDDDNIYIEIKCETPYRFIKNDGMVIMNNIFVTNDLNEKELNNYHDLIITKYGYNQDVMISFYFYSDGFANSISMIYNDRGQILINNFTAFGVGLHYAILMNTGISFINNLNIFRPNYYFNNTDRINVRLFMYKVIWNEGIDHGLTSEKCRFNDDICYFDDIDLEQTNGIVIITDSIIYGGGKVAVHNIRGHVEIYNTLISDTMYGLFSAWSTALIMNNCILKNIGFYHCGDFANTRWSNIWQNKAIFFKNVEYVQIENTVFDFYPLNGYILCISFDPNIQSVIIMKNNQFKNPVNFSTLNLNHFESFTKIAIDHYQNPDKEPYFLYDTTDILGNHPLNEHLLTFKGDVEVTFIGNIFEQNELITESINNAALYIKDTSLESINCISWNTFYGFSIYLEKGIITSCIHPNLHQIDNQCLDEFSSINMDINPIHTQHIFIATKINIPIIQIENNGHIVVDDATINTDFINNTNDISSYNHYNPFPMDFDGIITLLDVTMNDNEFPILIEYNQDCDNVCFQIFNHSFNQIRQLHLKCSLSNESTIFLNDETNIINYDYGIPTQIKLLSSDTLYPGGSLDIDFIIIDSYNNTINDYKGELHVILSSIDFNFQTRITINYDNSNNKYLCDICSTGLYIQNARMDTSFNKKFIINAIVENNLLSINNNITFTLIDCPIGYGLNNISSQCNRCYPGEFSLKSSISPCLSCNNILNKHHLNGVTCFGYNLIRISYGYWIVIAGFTNNAQNILENGQSISSIMCPTNYCNKNDNASYLESYNSGTLCALNRNPNAPLCGKCLPGYSELLGSTNCGICTRTHWELLIIIIVLAVLFTIGVVFTSSSRSKSRNNKNGTEKNHYL